MQGLAQRLRILGQSSQLPAQLNHHFSQSQLILNDRLQLVKEIGRIIAREQQFTLPNTHQWQLAKLDMTQKLASLLPADGRWLLGNLERLGQTTWGQLGQLGLQSAQLASLYFVGKLAGQLSGAILL